MQAAFPGIRTRSLSATYNCYGLVFANRRTVIPFPEDVQLLLDDDGYQRITERSKVSVGDVIVYRSNPDTEIKHAGIIVEVNPRPVGQRIEFDFMILSQWGFDGEYFHRESQVPERYGKHTEYYSERRIL